MFARNREKTLFFNLLQDRQGVCKATMRRVIATIVTVEKQ